MQSVVEAGFVRPEPQAGVGDVEDFFSVYCIPTILEGFGIVLCGHLLQVAVFEGFGVEDVRELKRIANRMRQNIVTMIGEAGSGHPGGSLSATELVTALYFNVMRHDPTRPAWPDRDRFILSKGHACPVLYCALAVTASLNR